MSRFTVKSAQLASDIPEPSPPAPSELPTVPSSTGYPNTVDGYKLMSEIGQGSFSIVHRAIVLDTNEEVAVKIIDLDKGSVNLEEIWREVAIMKQCNHPNVTPLHASFVSGPELWLVLPLLRFGSCLDIMKVSYPHGLEETIIASILKQTLEGMAYFHDNNHIHRDIKAGNILLSDNGQVQLADFGVSGIIDRSLYKTRQTFVGTPCWMAPEVMEQTAGYDFKADIWSFGITALELANGQAPMARFKPMKVLVMTLQNPPPTLDLNSGAHGPFSKQFKKMIDLCLHKDPTERPTAAKLLEHKFFKNAKKPEYIVEKLLNGLPPYAERQRILRSILAGTHTQPERPDANTGTDAPGSPVVLPELDEWDFGDEGDGAASAGGTADRGTGPASPASTATPEKHGRFSVKS